MSDDPPGERMDDDSAARAVAGTFRDLQPDHTRRSIERWLAARGVPQLIEGYSSEQRIDARAFPLIGVWIVVATVLIWMVRPGIYFAADRSVTCAWLGRPTARSAPISGPCCWRWWPRAC